MNEPLKLKLFSVYGQILNKKVLLEAWKHVKANKGCGGIDKVSIKDFDENLDLNIESLLQELKAKTYKPSPVLRKYIPKKNGKMRKSLKSLFNTVMPMSSRGGMDCK